MVAEYGLTYADAERLAQTIPSVKVAVPIKARAEDAWMGNRKVQVQFLATVPWFIQHHPMKIISGRFLSPLDMHRLMNVCVLGERVAHELFLFEDPLNKPVKLGSGVYTIIGIVQPEGATEEKGAFARGSTAQPERRLLRPHHHRTRARRRFRHPPPAREHASRAGGTERVDPDRDQPGGGRFHRPADRTDTGALSPKEKITN